MQQAENQSQADSYFTPALNVIYFVLALSQLVSYYKLTVMGG